MNIFNQDPNAPPTPVVLAPVAPQVAAPASVQVNVPIAPPVPPRPSGCGCPVMAIVIVLGLLIFALVLFTIVTGALGIPVFGRDMFDVVFKEFGKLVYGLTGNSYTRLGYQALLSVLVVGFAGLISGLAIGRGTK